MGSSQKITVRLIGLDQKEQHFIKVVFKLSESRDREYQLIHSNANIDQTDTHSDIVIVDKDNQNAISLWRKRLLSTDNTSKQNTVFITNNKADITLKNTILKPLVALKILNILDGISIEYSDNIKNIVPNITTPTKSTNFGISDNYDALVIDDSLAVRKHIESELNNYHCNIDFATNAEEGYWAIQKKVYSLVFLDIILPGMNGHELCKDIKGNTSLRNTPIVMLTSKSSPFDRVKGRLSGCNEYLTKPVKASKLHQIIEKYLIKVEAIAN